VVGDAAHAGQHHRVLDVQQVRQPRPHASSLLTGRSSLARRARQRPARATNRQPPPLPRSNAMRWTEVQSSSTQPRSELSTSTSGWDQTKRSA
jgi:hypothetical protein